MDVKQRAESQTIIPRGRKVSNINALVAGCFALTPQEKTLLRRQALFVDVRNGESENESPDQTEDDLSIPVHDIFSPNIGQLDTPALDEVQALVDIFKLLNPQFRLRCISAKRFIAE